MAHSILPSEIQPERPDGQLDQTQHNCRGKENLCKTHQSVSSACSAGSMLLLGSVLNRIKDGQQGQHGTWLQQKSGASKIPRLCEEIALAHPSGLRIESHRCTLAEHRKAMRTSMRGRWSREGRRDKLRVWHQLPPTSLARPKQETTLFGYG